LRQNRKKQSVRGIRALEPRLESFLSTEIEGFRNMIQAVASEMRWKAKSPEVYAEVVERIGSDARSFGGGH
jgi:hypothetical protein